MRTAAILIAVVAMAACGEDPQPKANSAPAVLGCCNARYKGLCREYTAEAEVGRVACQASGERWGDSACPVGQEFARCDLVDGDVYYYMDLYGWEGAKADCARIHGKIASIASR